MKIKKETGKFMSDNVVLVKYMAQLKSLSPKNKVKVDLDKSTPIKFTDEENLKLSFACIADEHYSKGEHLAHNLDNCFKDIENAPKKIDALLMAGDIVEMGTRMEYKRFFNVFDKHYKNLKILLTLGNHDARFFYKTNQKIIMNKVNEYLGINTNGKSYYSYDINGYTFIIIATEKRVMEKAYISPAQIEFLKSELTRATENGKPAFVMCHQAFQNTHGLPEVWKTGDMGEQSDEVRAVLENFKNVFFINGHLHGGIFEKTFEVLNEANGVYSLSIPCYKKQNNFGLTDDGIGYIGEVYNDKVIFKARNLCRGKDVTNEFAEYILNLK